MARCACGQCINDLKTSAGSFFPILSSAVSCSCPWHPRQLVRSQFQTPWTRALGCWTQVPHQTHIHEPTDREICPVKFGRFSFRQFPSSLSESFIHHRQTRTRESLPAGCCFMFPSVQISRSGRRTLGGSILWRASGDEVPSRTPHRAMCFVLSSWRETLLVLDRTPHNQNEQTNVGANL